MVEAADIWAAAEDEVQSLGAARGSQMRSFIHVRSLAIDTIAVVRSVQPNNPLAIYSVNQVMRWPDGLMWWSGLPAAVPLPTPGSGGGRWKARLGWTLHPSG
jgi:hypothetical protein